MRIQLTALLLLLSLVAGVPIGAAAESKSPPSVADELKALIIDLNEAGAKKDRAALERIYADDFMFVHSTGKAVLKAEQIDRILSDASGYSIPVHSFDGVQVYGDIAMLRTSDGPMYGINLYVRRGGGWRILQVQGTRKAPERKPIQLPSAATDNYIGKYEFSPGRSGVVSKEGDRLRWRGGGRPTVTLVPVSDTRFYAEESDAELTFVKGPEGKVAQLVLRLGTCQDSTAKKVE